MCVQSRHFYTQSSRLVARHTMLALWHFLAEWMYYATLKSVSSQPQKSTIVFRLDRNIFTLQSHKNTYAFSRSVQTRHFLHAIMPPCGKTYQAGYAIFSSTVDIFRDIKVCFIATSKLYDWLRIQIYMFVDIWFVIITKTCIFAGIVRAFPSHSPATWWQNVPKWLCVIL